MALSNFRLGFADTIIPIIHVHEASLIFIPLSKFWNTNLCSEGYKEFINQLFL